MNNVDAVPLTKNTDEEKWKPVGRDAHADAIVFLYMYYVYCSGSSIMKINL